MLRIIIVSLILGGLCAEDQKPVTLDANKPADAIQILDVLTRENTYKRAQADAVTASLVTLAKCVKELEELKAARKAEPGGK